MKLNNILSVYRILGEAKIATLNDEEAIKVLKIRRTLRPHVEDYEAFLKDAQEKFRPANFDEIVSRNQEKELTEEDNIALSFFEDKVRAVILPELEKEVKIELQTINEDSAIKLLKENGWQIKMLDKLNCIV